MLPGESVDLGNLLVIDPGYLDGQIVLQGPNESPGHDSLLRGLLHASDDDLDMDGVPDSLGTYGVYWSSVSADGVDQLAAGATHTAAFGTPTRIFPCHSIPTASPSRAIMSWPWAG